MRTAFFSSPVAEITFVPVIEKAEKDSVAHFRDHKHITQVELAAVIGMCSLVKVHHLLLKEADTHSPGYVKSYRPCTVKK